MFIVAVNLGVPGSVTDWQAIGPFETEAAADMVMGDVNEMARAGVIVVDRVIVIPMISYIEAIEGGLSGFLVRLQQGE